MVAEQLENAPTLFPLLAEPIEVGRSSKAALRLPHPTVSRRHATLRPAAGGISVEDHDSRYGTFINGLQIRAGLAKPGDLIRFGSATAYRVEPSALRLDAAAGGMGLEADGLTLAVPQSAGNGEKTLIRGLGFQIEPDAMVGVLGPSGSGKSTLLRCLSSRLPPRLGRLLFDGDQDAYAEPDAYRALIGHVPQGDLVFLPLSALENLRFAARLRLGPDASPGDIDAAVDDALERVGLTEHANKPAAVLSGGQRKRLSVAVELLRRPRLLMLDEPTSGLDPAAEALLMGQLKQVARRGTTVVCATHLMDNVRLFDELIVLGVREGVGRLAYAGPPDGLLTRFDRRHYADVYELLADGRFDPIDREPTDRPSGTSVGPRAVASGSKPSTKPVVETSAANGTPSAVWQIPIVADRASRILVRDRGLMAAMVAQPAVLGLLVGLTQYYAVSAFPILFFAVVVAIWLGLNNSARDLVRERRLYLRDRLAGLRPEAYLTAKAAIQAAAGAGQLLVLLVVLRLTCRLSLTYPAALRDLDETSALWMFLVMFAAYLGGVGLGLLASTWAKTEEAAVALLPILILPQLLLSAVATQATSVGGYDRDRPFRPIVMTLTDRRELPGPAILADALSMVCLSRPAAIVAERPDVADHRAVWLGDLLHLMALLLATWAAVYLAFLQSERRWLNLDGSG